MCQPQQEVFIHVVSVDLPKSVLTTQIRDKQQTQVFWKEFPIRLRMLRFDLYEMQLETDGFRAQCQNSGAVPYENHKPQITALFLHFPPVKIKSAISNIPY